MEKIPLYKVPKETLPVELPVAWIANLRQTAGDLGISISSVARMAIRIGAPILQAQHLGLERTVQRECLKAAGMKKSRKSNFG